MDWALYGIGFHDGRACLVAEQIHSVGSMVPQQMVGPRACFAFGIDVFAAEEIGLHIHLLDVQFACGDFIVQVLVRRVEAAGMAYHRYQACGLLQGQHFFGVAQGISQGYFHLHVFACFQASQGLGGVHLGRGTQNHCIHLV